MVSNSNMQKAILISLLVLSNSLFLAGQVYVPPPLRIEIPFEAAWNAMRDVLSERKAEIEVEERGRGEIRTRYTEFISGPLTNDYLPKIGETPKLADAYWIKAEYRYEITVQFIQAKQTLVYVNTNIRGLRRDFLGKETWVVIPTNGNKEEELLNQFGRRLFGETFSLDTPGPGLWRREPRDAPANLSGRIPRTTGPERP
jgi:hypothetical protein